MVILNWYRTYFVFMNQKSKVSFDLDVPGYITIGSWIYCPPFNWYSNE
jgi:hypothetical protein